MRIGDIVRIITHSTHASRLAVVEQQGPRTPGKPRWLEVFVPGSTVEGGSILTLDDTVCEPVGDISLTAVMGAGGSKRQGCRVGVMGSRARWVDVPVGKGKMKARDVRRVALWMALAKGGVA